MGIYYYGGQGLTTSFGGRLHHFQRTKEFEHYIVTVVSLEDISLDYFSCGNFRLCWCM